MRNILYFFLFISIASCTSNTIFKKPDDLITPDKMVDLLTDMYLATAAKPSTNKNKERNIDYTYLVFEKHGIDTAQFRRSNYYYTTKIDDYEAIFERVKTRIEKLNTDFKFIKNERDSIKKDSIQKIKFTKDSIIKVKFTLDSIFLDSINKTMIDTTLWYDLKKLKEIKISGKIDSLRMLVKKIDSLHKEEKLIKTDTIANKEKELH
ncbi:DUF4296 domain-containing protein [Bacteroidota bacterium]